jgi:hypothetical protein
MKRGRIRMAKVSMHLGFTFRVGDLSTNQYGRIDLSVDQIDTDLPIEEQIKDSKNAAENIWEFVKESVDIRIDEVLDGDEASSG